MPSATTHAEPTGLTKNDSSIIKGVAILLMLWNHCFLPGRFDGCDLVFSPLTQGTVEGIASFCKICVSLFAFVSGYGLCCSLQSLDRRSGFTSRTIASWYRTRYLRSFSGYWFIVIVAWIVCQCLDGLTVAVYFKDGSMFTGLCNMLFDLSGTSSFFGTPTLIATWWYMSAALAFILLAPLIYRLMDRFSGVLCLALVCMATRVSGGFPGSINWLSFLPAFIIGMICAHSGFFQKVQLLCSSSKAKHVCLVLVLLLLMLACYKFPSHFPKKYFWDFSWGFFVIIYVTLIKCTLPHIPFVRDAFVFLGSWSAEIYLVHSFLRARYASPIVYASGPFILVMVRLLLMSLAVCALIRILKRVVHYDSLIGLVEKRLSEENGTGNHES